MPESKRHIYFKNLDGLRFICFLSVFLAHSFHTKYPHLQEANLYQFIKIDILANANLGVNCFFVLSGFLITYLIIQEKKINGQINIKRFWIRRILRIWPLYYFCVFWGFIAFPFIKSLFGQIPNESATVLPYLFFFNNFEIIHTGPPDASILWVLWSIAIEEQFYLFWPVLLYLLPIRYYYLPFVGIIIISTIFRTFNDDFKVLHYHTLSCIGDMAVGALGAWCISEIPELKVAITKWRKYQIALIYLSFVFLYLFRDELLAFYPTFQSVDRLLISLVFLSIILEQNYAKYSFFKLGDFKYISQLGLISYGLYCLHTTALLATTTLTHKLGIDTKLWQLFLLNGLLSMAITILLAKFSYRFYEYPFLKLKEQFAYFVKKK